MIKRVSVLFLIAIMLAAFGCAKPSSEQGNDNKETPIPQENANASDSRQALLGFIIDDDGSMAAYMAMYGFLRTAETLGYPAKLFRAKPGAPAQSAVQNAIDEGCTGLMVFNPGGVNDKAVKLAVDSGVNVVIPYHECAIPGINSNVVADTGEYIEELSRGLATRLTERSLKSGRILVYGRDTAATCEQFARSIGEYYPQYTVDSFNRVAVDEEGAIEELAQYILYNRDIKGMYVADSDLASIAVTARKRAQNVFSSKGAPTPTPVQGTPVAAPALTPNPNLLTSITVTIFASGLSDENYKLFNDSDIYALCIEPYYEAATQATMYLDKLTGGDEIPERARINRPIAYADTIDKYTAIFDRMKEMFGILEQNG
ncbi:MAG: hypothetical protein RR232_01670 [Clostridia bacterium]